MNIDTILFDFDGTLIDTNELIVTSFVHTFEKYGYKFTEEEILQFNGPPLTETFQAINPEQADEMLQTYREHNAKYHDQYVSLFPHVRETLAALKDKGCRLAIVSAKMRVGVEQGLRATKIGEFFDTIVTIDDVKNPKPHPEPVLLALKQLEAKPEQAIMVGDNYHDILSGQKAGTKTAGVSWSVKGAAYLEEFHPNYMLEDMKDLLDIIEVSA